MTDALCTFLVDRASTLSDEPVTLTPCGHEEGDHVFEGTPDAYCRGCYGERYTDGDEHEFSTAPIVDAVPEVT